MTRSVTSLSLAALLLSTSVTAADRYTIDPAHTFPTLEFSHMDISTWRGRFNRTTGSVVLDRAAKTGTVDIQVDTRSIDFGLDAMDEFALQKDWLNAEAFPVMTYRGGLQFRDDVPVALDGQLTLRGVTKPLKLTLDTFRCVPHPMLKREVCGADVSGEMNRADWGMDQYAEGRAGIVRLKIQVEAIRDE